MTDGSEMDIPCLETITSYREIMEWLDIADQRMGLDELDRKSNQLW